MLHLRPPLTEPSKDATSQAVAHVKKVNDASTSALSNADMAPIIRAYAQDLGDASDKSAHDEARLAKVEAQTRVLAEAVVAITETADSLAPAVKAVKDEM
jgi:hypothetical protein